MVRVDKVVDRVAAGVVHALVAGRSPGESAEDMSAHVRALSDAMQRHLEAYIAADRHYRGELMDLQAAAEAAERRTRDLGALCVDVLEELRRDNPTGARQRLEGAIHAAG